MNESATVPIGLNTLDTGQNGLLHGNSTFPYIRKLFHWLWQEFCTGNVEVEFLDGRESITYEG